MFKCSGLLNPDLQEFTGNQVSSEREAFHAAVVSTITFCCGDSHGQAFIWNEADGVVALDFDYATDVAYDGSVVVGRVHGFSPTVTLQWQPSTDPDGDAVTCDVYNCTDGDPLNNCVPVENAAMHRPSGGVYMAGLSLGGGIMLLGFAFTWTARGSQQTVLLVVFLVISTPLASCNNHNDDDNDNPNYRSCEVSGLAPGTTYYWSDVANDGIGGVTPGEVWSYTTQ